MFFLDSPTEAIQRGIVKFYYFKVAQTNFRWDFPSWEALPFQHLLLSASCTIQSYSPELEPRSNKTSIHFIFFGFTTLCMFTERKTAISVWRLYYTHCTRSACFLVGDPGPVEQQSEAFPRRALHPGVASVCSRWRVPTDSSSGGSHPLHERGWEGTLGPAGKVGVQAPLCGPHCTGPAPPRSLEAV